MNAKLPSPIGARGVRREQGVVLFIALIAMVVMSLAGVALIRSVDTSGSVSGNLAFREASIAPVNFAIEKATFALFGTPSGVTPAVAPTITNRNADNTALSYYASLQPGELANGAPTALGGTYPPTGYPGATDVDPTGAETRVIVERLCNAAGLPVINTCDELPPKVSQGMTTMKLKGPTLPPIPLYRITVRVDLPGTNTVSYAQAVIME